MPMLESRLHIALADDDVNLSTVLADYLVARSYRVDVFRDGQSVLAAIRQGHYDLCILDINMPNGTGYEVLKELRRTANDIPVIMLTGRQAREDILRAYELGCDDYVTKPFSMDILICRIEAVVRRSRLAAVSTQTKFLLGSKQFDSVRQTMDGEHMSARESDLLLMLCRNMDQLVERHVILCAIWNTDDIFSSRSLSVYINHLRGYLEDTGMRIIGVHGKGYKLVKD